MVTLYLTPAVYILLSNFESAFSRRKAVKTSHSGAMPIPETGAARS
jgi:hypothetical protein